MSRHVCHEMVISSKLHVTNATAERLLPGMGPNVVLQVAVARKPRMADVATERFLARMRPHVSDKVGV